MIQRLSILLSIACLPLSAALNTDIDELRTSHTEFAFSLYPAIDKAEENLIFSPYSISSCLSMLYIGARGDTEFQIQKALHLDIDRKQIAKASFGLSQSLQPSQSDSKTYKLHTAGAIWVDQGTFLLTDFRYAIEEQFKAKLGVINFASPQSATATINDWISLQTEHKIQNLLQADDINSLTRLVLTNATYFEGQWALAFDPKLTQDLPFYSSVEKSANVKMMQQTLSAPYYENDLIQAAALPFIGQTNAGGRLALVILLPKSQGNFDEMVSELPNSFTSWLSSMSMAALEIKLPKFSFSTRLNLQSPLQALGMEDAFDSNANFIGIDGLRDLFLNRVIHEAFFALDENGVIAAASTAAPIGMKALPPKEPSTPLIVDHPFVFFIVDLKSLEMLFMGKVVNPAI